MLSTIIPVTDAKAVLPSLIRRAVNDFEVILTVNGRAKVALVEVDQYYEIFKLIKKAAKTSPLNIKNINSKLQNSVDGINFTNENDITVWWKKEK